MRLRERLDGLGRRWQWLATALTVHDRVREVNGRALAAQITLATFLSIFPLLLVAIAVVGFFSAGSGHLAADVVDRLGLSGQAATTVSTAVKAAEHSRRVASTVGLLGLLWAGLGVVRALQDAYNTVWRVRARGLKDRLYGLAWLVGAAVLFAASAFVVAVLGYLPMAFVLVPVGVLVTFATDVGLLLWTSRVLPNRQVPWRALVPGAVVGAVGLEVLKAAGSILVPRIVASSSALYGSIGVVFAILSWLLVFGRLLVYAEMFNVVRWDRRRPSLDARRNVEPRRSDGTRPASSAAPAPASGGRRAS